MFLFFFFSSRRRHTRLQGDWSSDVCSSDLPLLEEVAGTLPAEDVVGRVPPGCALEVARAHEELEEEGRLVELPAALRIRQDAREQLVGPLPTEEMLLVGRLRVTVPRRDHHALDAEVHHRVEELARTERVVAVEKRRVGC